MKKSKEPPVSILIPVYNGEKTLKQCLDSVLKQTYKNYEVIVVDDNSTDRTKEIIEDFQKRNNRVRYLFESKQTRGAARLKGGKNAKGEIVLMTDSDCIVPENWIREMIEPIIKKNQASVQGLKKPVIINYWTKKIQEEEEKLINLRIKDKKIGLLDTANFALKKEIFKEIGYTNPDMVYGEDTELEIRLRAKGYFIDFKKIYVSHYHPDTALKVFKKLFKKGAWNQKIKRMHAFQKDIFMKQDIINHFTYLCGIFLELLTMHKNFRYDSVTGLGWRVGSFYGWIKK